MPPWKVHMILKQAPLVGWRSSPKARLAIYLLLFLPLPLLGQNIKGTFSLTTPSTQCYNNHGQIVGGFAPPTVTGTFTGIVYINRSGSLIPLTLMLMPDLIANGGSIAIFSGDLNAPGSLGVPTFTVSACGLS